METMATEFICPKCGGTGFVIVEGANLSGAKPCDCRLLGRSERLEDRSQIPPLYRNASFDSFSVPGPENPNSRRDLTNILLAVKNYVRDFPNVKPPGLLLLGDSGTGKTHLAVAALRKIMEKGFEGLFCDYQNLLDRIRSGFDPVSNAADREAYRMALDAEVLLLDDLGAQRVLEWTQDTVTSIITYRCNHGKALIATSNLREPMATFAGQSKKSASGHIEYSRTLEECLGTRARSRLFEMCTVIRMPLVEDYRLPKERTF
jgi:DNA replication protein DnaC